MVKNLPAMQEISVLIPGSENGEEENRDPFQYSCLENIMNRGAWWATVHEVTKRHARVPDTHRFLEEDHRDK